MNRTSYLTLLATVVALGCADEEGGGGNASSAASNSTTQATGGDTVAAVQSSSAALSGGGGEHGVSTATGGGAGGAPEATPEECFEIHDNDECFAAGCNLFLFHPRVFTVVDDVCEATDDLGHCFLQDENSGGNFTPEAYVRDFGEGAPYVIGLSGEAPLYGWTECSAEIAVDIRECCCVQSGDLSEVCADITPFPAR